MKGPIPPAGPSELERSIEGIAVDAQSETSLPLLSSLMAALDDLLEPSAFRDMAPNGLQVPGPERVTKVVTGVTAQRELIDRAVVLGAELVLVHHGLFWDFQAPGLTPTTAERRARCSSTTSGWPPTTCRSTRIPRSATTPSSPNGSGARATSASPRSGARASSPPTASLRPSCSPV
jgi:hypothetical protein